MTVARITISLPDVAAFELTTLAKQWATSRGGVVTRLMEEFRARQMELAMAEGYIAMAESTLREVNDAFAAQAEVVLRD